MDQSRQGSWADRFLFFTVIVLFLFCVSSLSELYTMLKEFREHYEYLNQRIGELEIESAQNSNEIRTLENIIFNDWEVNQ